MLPCRCTGVHDVRRPAPAATALPLEGSAACMAHVSAGRTRDRYQRAYRGTQGGPQDNCVPSKLHRAVQWSFLHSWSPTSQDCTYCQRQSKSMFLRSPFAKKPSLLASKLDGIKVAAGRIIRLCQALYEQQTRSSASSIVNCICDKPFACQERDGPTCQLPPCRTCNCPAMMTPRSAHPIDTHRFKYAVDVNKAARADPARILVRTSQSGWGDTAVCAQGATLRTQLQCAASKHRKRHQKSVGHICP